MIANRQAKLETLTHVKMKRQFAQKKTFQSYLFIGPNKEDLRERTRKLATSVGIDIEKVSQDVFKIEALKTSISIDQIRALKGHIFQKPLKEKHKFVIIEEAHRATPEAQNALLKILEEPPSHAIIVLESKTKHAILPTVISRTITEEISYGDVSSKSSIFENGVGEALLKINSIGNSQEFIDDEIIILDEMLLAWARGKRVKLEKNQIIRALEHCAAAKQMITSNVNPTFVLAELILATNASGELEI
ncbi:MAG: hypothetical protein NUV69_00260 [Candidatus Curtissbacteria bacterium]|nr:hypothetical protein [Candidatus Curtissbacteria bacterium]